MAHLTQKEFQQAIAALAAEFGLQRLRDRFVKLNGLVTRRKVMSAEGLADQLYVLSSGLRRQVPATYAFQVIWSETVSAKLGEEGEKKLESVAEAVNACLGEHDQILPEKLAELEPALAEYERVLSAALGGEVARLDMLLKAVPSVAEHLRSKPPHPAPAATDAPG